MLSSESARDLFDKYFSDDLSDGFKFYDFLRAEKCYKKVDEHHMKWLLGKLQTLIASNLEENKKDLKDLYVFQKYQWYKIYHNNFCKQYKYRKFLVD